MSSRKQLKHIPRLLGLHVPQKKPLNFKQQKRHSKRIRLFFFIYYTRCPLQLPHSQTFGDNGFNRLFCQYDFLVLWVKCLHEDVKCLHEVVKCIHKGLVTLSLHLIY